MHAKGANNEYMYRIVIKVQFKDKINSYLTYTKQTPQCRILEVLMDIRKEKIFVGLRSIEVSN
jgi:hypothetical protein